MRSQLRYGPITVAIITLLDGIVKWVSLLLRVLFVGVTMMCDK